MSQIWNYNFQQIDDAGEHLVLRPLNLSSHFDGRHMSLTVGIDLGTTNSLCAIFQDGKPRLIANSHGEYLTPSVVGLTESGQIIVGAAARELRVVHPDRAASCFKRHMGSDHKYSHC